MRDDGVSLLDKLFPGAPPHTKNTRVALRPGSPENLTQHTGSTARTASNVSGRWASVCTLELRGVTQKQIAEALGMSENGVSSIVNDERYIEYRAERLAALDDDFVAMKPLAFAALKGALNSADENTALRASETWFKGAGFGGYSKREQQSTTLSAEDIAQALLRQGSSPLVQVNTQVNVAADASGTTSATTIIDASTE